MPPFHNLKRQYARARERADSESQHAVLVTDVGCQIGVRDHGAQVIQNLLSGRNRITYPRFEPIAECEEVTV